MAVSNGQDANQTTFNSAFISRTQDSDTTAKVGLKNTSDPDSGAVINNAQRLINEVRDAAGVAGEGDTSSKTYSSTAFVANGDDRKVAIGKLDAALQVADQNASDALSEATDLRTLTGTSTGETDLGTFTGSTIADNRKIKQALQDLEDEVELKLDASEKGAASGVAPLDGSSKIPVAYLPSSVETLLGSWDASTNTPTLADGTGDMGDKYRVSVAGTQNLGSGAITFAINDLVYYASGQWFKIDGTDDVHSVNGASGAVVLDTDDISEGSSNLYWTNARFDTRFGTKSIDALSDVDTTTVTPSISDVLTYDGVKWAPAAPASGAPNVSIATGTLAINHGGTGQTTAAAAVDALLPTQSGNAGKVLGTNGTTHSWVAGAALVPHITQLTSGSGTFTVNTSTVWMRVRMVGGGGGGGGSGTGSPGDGTAGSSTTFDTLTAGGGDNSQRYRGGGGGSSGGGNVLNAPGIPGQSTPGNTSPTLNQNYGGAGGSSLLGGGGHAGLNGGGVGNTAAANTGGGGGGSGAPNTAPGAAGGGGGGYVEHIYTSPASSYSYAVGAGGSGGTAGTGGGAGGGGGSGLIIVEEYY